MTLEEFTRELEIEFEDLETGTLTPETNYKEIEDWSSMHVLIVIAFVDANFDIILSASELKNTVTITDLYDIVQNKIS